MKTITRSMNSAPAKGRSFNLFLLNTRLLTAFATALLFVPGLHAGQIVPASSKPGSSSSTSSGSAQGSSSSSAAAQAAAAAAAQRSQRAQEALSRSTQSLQSLQAAQAAARAAALAGPNNLGTNPNNTSVQLPDVPDGLGSGGLNPTNVGSWVNANAPTQTTTGTKTQVDIKQTDSQALLTWQTFNIGKNTTLNFDQSAGGSNAGQWIAFNKVNDPTQAPSQILGSIKAQGQVYVINQNGIIFGGSSQVNAHALVASSLPINDNLVARGLLNNPDLQFLFSQDAIPALSSGTTPAFTPPASYLPGGKSGDVIVQAGAQLTSPTTADHVGGKIALIGANVSNAGTISTQDGQTILAAGRQVGLFAHDSADPSLRGLDVYIGAVDALSGTATNSGLIDIARANLTIAGKNVNQLGVVNSTTSASLNGRIDLLANYNAQPMLVSGGTGQVLKMFSTKSGTVTLGGGSLTQILPELTSAEKVVGTKLALNSKINLQGQAIYLGANSTLLAPGADVSLNAGRWVSQGEGYSFVNTAGQVYLDNGALIDVSGSINVQASVADNIISVELRGSELADSPLQRDGPLRGQTIQVDIRQTGVADGKFWIGTPLADASGYVGLVQRSVGELTTAGGTVNIKAGSSVVMQSGANIDVSGGWVDYQGGVVKTTKVFSNGKVYDISQATPDRIYQGLDTGSTSDYVKWGISENWGQTPQAQGTYEAGYRQGANAGSLSITAPAMALDGQVYGQSVAGSRQRTLAQTLQTKFSGYSALPTILATSAMPQSGSLSLSFQGQTTVSGVTGNPFYSPTPPSISFQSGTTLAPADAFVLDSQGVPQDLRADRRNTVELSPDLINKNGFGSLKIENPDGTISVPSNVSLQTSAGGAIAFIGSNIDIQGRITTPGGSQSYTVYDYSPYADTFLPPLEVFDIKPAYDPNRGNFTLGSEGALSSAGLIVDDRVDANQSLVTKGGSIVIAGNNVNLSTGAVVDVSGGVAVSSTGKFTYGDGGSISLQAGYDPSKTSLLGGKLIEGATLKGFSGAKGGSLALQVPAVQIGGSTTNTDVFLLSPEFFTQGGFASYNISGTGLATALTGQYVPGLVVASNVTLAPTVESWLAVDGSGEEPVTLTRVTLAEGVRNPVSLTLRAPGIVEPYANGTAFARGDVVIAENAVIRTDAKGSVVISGQTVDIRGSIFTPGGSISVSGANRSTGILFPDQVLEASQHALATVHLGNESVLSAAGKTVLTPDVLGLRSGFVLDGGKIQISGNIVAESGSLLDVSGTSGVLDLLPSFSLGNSRSGNNLISASAARGGTTIATSGGSITLKGGQELFSDATLKGKSGGVNASGGSFSISSGYFIPASSLTPSLPTDTTLTVTQSGPTIPSATNLPGQIGVGHEVLDANGVAYSGQGYFAADSLQGAGFDFVTLSGNRGTVKFSGPVTLSAGRSLKVGDGGFISADAAVNLSSSYVALGTAFLGPLTVEQQAASTFLDGNGAAFYKLPTYGTGRLTVTAGLIDVGNLSLQNIGTAQLLADNGDIRGDGTFNVAGDITLRASQIYPTTAVTFNIEAYNHGVTEGSVTIQSSSTRSLPLSAGGQLNVYGAVINQGGVLRAPFGTINLGWNGTSTAPVGEITNTSVPVTRQLNLLSGSVTSVSAIDPITGKGVVIPYGTNLNGVSWIDPSGVDITAGGLPTKSVNLSSTNIDDQAGSTIDVRGGGDLYAYRWVKGLGGSQDVLASATSFAVIPAYGADYAPYDPGYANGTLNPGDKIYLSGGGGLPAGMYTLLPARYALLPGAFLITPKSVAPGGTAVQPDGSAITSGYRFNGQNTPAQGGTLLSSFEIVSSAVARTRSEYQDYSANTYLKQAAIDRKVAVPRLPVDSGKLVLAATQSLILDGRVSSQSLDSSGLGSQVDISSSNAIRIAGPGAVAAPGELVLDSASLSAFGADSLLIGGVRGFSAQGTTVTATTNNLTVDNTGASLIGPDVILVSSGNLTLAAGSSIQSTGLALGSAEDLFLGSSSVSGSGDGALVRVSLDPSAGILRQGVSNSTVPNLTIQSGASLSGASLILDSTAHTNLSSTAVLSGENISLSSDRISLQLGDPGSLQPNAGLLLSESNLQSLQASARNLSLVSYSSIDFYGNGSIGTVDASSNYSITGLTLSAAEIRGFNNGGASVELNASSITLDNSPGRSGPGAVSATSGSLVLNAKTVQLGDNQMNISQISTVDVNASGGILVQGNGGLTTAGDLNLSAPLITGAAGSHQVLTASGGALNVAASSGTSTVTGGLGAFLDLRGSSVSVAGNVVLPSGTIELHAASGDVQVNGVLDAGGTKKTFFDLAKYTDGGKVVLSSTGGSVHIGSGATVSVAAQSGGGDAGTLQVSAAQGTFVNDGLIRGQSGQGGTGGNFLLDVATLNPNSTLGGNDLASLASQLGTGGFDSTQSIRIRGGGNAGVDNDVFVTSDTTLKARNFNLSADRGSITVAGTVDAAGQTGGSIQLQAKENLILASGSVLDVSAQTFDSAGKGGSVSLEAGSQTNGSFSNVALGSGPQLDIRTGSTIKLDVAANTNSTTTAANQALGKFGGTLHLRAPQSSGNTDLQIQAINGSITGASKIVVEGYQVFTPAGGAINTVTSAVQANGNTFAGNTTAISSRLLANNSGLSPVTVIAPGAEIINPTGDLTLASDWNLGTFRFGPKGVAGVLTLRAKGNLVFSGSLSDGFSSSLFNATLQTQNSLVPVNAQSWSYRLVAGSDFAAADSHQVLANTAVYDPVTGLAVPGTATGSLLLGNFVFGNNGIPIALGGASATTSAALSGRYQVIRTGTGDIDIATAGDLLLQNEFASIYSAGVSVADITMGGTFDRPILRIGNQIFSPLQYAAQYSLAGGNITIASQGNIAHVTQNNAGQIVQDSQKELPNNWLYRRGFVATTGSQAGEFGTGRWGDIASTSWWVDFSNFFEGVGALGGGNVVLSAGHDISNVDAVIPTNSRTTKQTSSGDKTAANQTTVELGGGDLVVSAGNDINGGVYYVERGQGRLDAGGDIRTNSTRSASLGPITNPASLNDSRTWLPTTLFLGKGSFEVEAEGNVLLGPVANPFLLPQAVNNSYWYKTYFSTYASTDTVDVRSLTGNVTLRESATMLADNQARPLLYNWLNAIYVLDTFTPSLSSYQPWLRLTETSVGDPFAVIVALQPATLKATAFSGDINAVGNITLSPSRTGTLDLAAAGSVNALQPTGRSNVLVANASNIAWTAAAINLSDADPTAIPGVLTPYAYQVIVGGTSASNSAALSSNSLDLSFINNLFAESGSTLGDYAILQTKQQLHASINGTALHAGDTTPVRIYAGEGDISGLTLFSGKASRLIAGQDVTDVALYIQNTGTEDVSLVSAGRDVILYNPNSSLRTLAQAQGNAVNLGSETLAGDIQINGPGTLQVLAGSNLDLGIGPNNADGTGLGITSIGNKRNPFLPFAGADIVVAAGLGSSAGLGQGLDFDAFIPQFVTSTAGTAYLTELGLTPVTFNQLSEEQQHLAALQIFYWVLRDAGRDHGDPASPFFGSYDNAMAAIEVLFPDAGSGDITLTSRQIKTQSGGDISLLAPGGNLIVGFDIAGVQPADQGILTESGGRISIFTDQDVIVGTSRIFTLRGGDVTIWSTNGDVAAGASSKTVQSAPPTRVLIDPQSGNVQTDLAGLATGGGIGVLASVAGVAPGNVDLVAPNGTVDAGDAGIRVSGNLNISAAQVVNAGNIQTGGTNTGGTVTAPATPSLAAVSPSSSAAAASSAATSQAAANQNRKKEEEDEGLPSLITVEVIGYGGNDDNKDKPTQL